MVIVRVRDVLKPDDYIEIIEVGNIKVFRKIEVSEIRAVLKNITEKFNNLSEEELDKIALEAKKWSRRK